MTAKRAWHPAAVLALAFACTIALGTVLLMLPWASARGDSAPFLTALFTATSAVTVTGLVTVDTGTYWSFLGQNIIMLLFQVGGFGMMMSATLMVLFLGAQMRLRTRLLLQAETKALNLGDVRAVAKVVLVVTLVSELVVAAILSARIATTMDVTLTQALWLGLFHAISAFNNAGFSVWSDSLMSHVQDAWILVPIMCAIMIGGVGFPVMSEVWARTKQFFARKFRRHMRSTAPLERWSIHAVLTLWGTLALVVGGTLVLWWAEAHNPKTLAPLAWYEQGLAALFASVAARTAGFNALDMGALQLESIVLHYVLMFIGAGSAGTAGGVKVTTSLVILLIVWNEVRGKRDVEFRGRRLPVATQRQALTILVLSSMAVALATLLIIPMTNFPLDQVLFEVVSAFGTVGLSMGITSQLPPSAQWVIIILMYCGRIGVMTLVMAFAMRAQIQGYRYPEERPIVG